jgi:hypothetical protein
MSNNSGKVSGRHASPSTGLRINFSWHPGRVSTCLWCCRLDAGSRPAALPGMTGCHECREQVEMLFLSSEVK